MKNNYRSEEEQALGLTKLTLTMLALFWLTNVFGSPIIPGNPSVNWARYYGGAGYDDARSIYIDPSGNVWITGTIAASSAAQMVNPQNTYRGGSYDAYLLLINSEGDIQWSRFIGGLGDDYGLAVTAGPDHTIVVGGSTSSMSGITADGAQSTFGGGATDGYLATFFQDGTPNWGAYVGGSGDESVTTISSEGYEKIVVGGQTNSANFEVTTGGQTTYGGGANDGFVRVYNESGSIAWSSFIGGAQNDRVTGVGYDPATGGAYATGFLSGNTIALFPGSQYGGGACDGFLAKFHDDGTIEWSQCIGGAGNDECSALTRDESGNLILCGTTTAAFDVVNAEQSTYGGGSLDGFLMRLSDSGVVIWSTLFGGNGVDQPADVRVNFLGEVYMVMNTTSNGLSTENAFQTANGGGVDALITKWTEEGDVKWSTYLGGISDDQGFRIGVTNRDRVLTVGRTFSSELNDGNLQNTFSGNADGFVGEVADCNNPIVNIHTSDDTIFCDGLRASFCAGTAHHIRWNTGDTTMTTDVDTTMLVTAIGINNDGCASRSNQIQVIVLPRPEITIFADGPTEFCDTGSVALFAAGLDDLEWNTGELGESIIAAEERAYYATGIGPNGCQGSSPVVQVTIHHSPDVQMAAASTDICISDGPVPLIALPLGGNYFGEGIVGSTFDPLVAGGGDHTLYYVFTDENGCSGTSAPITINVKYHETVLMSSEDSLCINAGSILLSGSPAGGTFSGNGVMNNLFFPAMAGIGLQEVSYSFIDENGCNNVATQNILVDACNSVDDITAATLEMYPNPADNEFVIEPTWTEMYEYHVYDAGGRMVRQGYATRRMIINSSDLAEGIYQLVAVYKDEVLTSKLFIHHP